MKKIANRFFYRIDGQDHPIPGTLQRFNHKPAIGRWREIAANVCCDPEDELISFLLTGDNPSHCNVITTSDIDTPDNDLTFTHFMKFIGQEEQGEFIVSIPLQALDAPSGSYQVAPTGTIPIPGGLTGLYKVILSFTTSSDYPGVNFLDANGDIIQTEGTDDPIVSGNALGVTTNAFDITRLASFNFTSQCGG